MKSKAAAEAEARIAEEIRAACRMVMVMPLYPVGEEEEPLCDPRDANFVWPEGRAEFEKLVEGTVGEGVMVFPARLSQLSYRYEQLRRKVADKFDLTVIEHADERKATGPLPLLERLIFPRLAMRVHLLRRHFAAFQQKKAGKPMGTPQEEAEALVGALRAGGLSDDFIAALNEGVEDACAFMTTALRRREYDADALERAREALARALRDAHALREARSVDERRFQAERSAQFADLAAAQNEVRRLQAELREMSEHRPLEPLESHLVRLAAAIPSPPPMEPQGEPMEQLPLPDNLDLVRRVADVATPPPPPQEAEPASSTPTPELEEM